MSILGNLVGRHSHSFVGSAADGVVWGTFPHSLPGTNPEFVVPQVKSIEAVGTDGANGVPAILCLGGNASIGTVGYVMASSPSVPTILVDLRYEVVHSSIR